MVNKDKFYSNSKCKILSQTVKELINKLDNELKNIGYIYEAVWRNDTESGSNVFVFEIPLDKRRRSNVKNLITLRLQNNFLKVEVYLGERNKNYYKVLEAKSLDNAMAKDIKDKYCTIVK